MRILYSSDISTPELDVDTGIPLLHISLLLGLPDFFNWISFHRLPVAPPAQTRPRLCRELATSQRQVQPQPPVPLLFNCTATLALQQPAASRRVFFAFRRSTTPLAQASSPDILDIADCILRRRWHQAPVNPPPKHRAMPLPRA